MRVTQASTISRPDHADVSPGEIHVLSLLEYGHEHQ